MNITRTVTVAVSYREIVAALKAAHPGSVHIQSLPNEQGGGIEVATTQGKGLVIRSTSNVAEVADVVQKLLSVA